MEVLAFSTPLCPPRALGETPLGARFTRGPWGSETEAGLHVLKTSGAEAKGSEEQTVPCGWSTVAGEAPPRLASGPRELGCLGKGPEPGLGPAPVGPPWAFPELLGPALQGGRLRPQHEPELPQSWRPQLKVEWGWGARGRMAGPVFGLCNWDGLSKPAHTLTPMT